MSAPSRVLAHTGPMVLALVVMVPFIGPRWAQYLALALIVGLCIVTGAAMAYADMRAEALAATTPTIQENEETPA